MTITAIDPSAALVLVDLQAGTLGNPAIQPVDDVVANATALLDAFRERNATVVIATIDGTPAGRNDVGSTPMVLPEPLTAPVVAVEPTDVRVIRRTWSAFTGTDLHEQLAARDVTQVVIAGVATSFGVESTARSAYDLGYNVVVVTDAIKDMRAESHDASLARVFPILGETATAAEVLLAL